MNNHQEMGRAVSTSQLAALLHDTRCRGMYDADAMPGHSTPLARIETSPFLPGLVEYSLTQQELPTIQEIAVLFVDIADSTRTVLRQPPEKALALVQRFMSIVTEVTLAHCGDVKDYEGDGALLYFGSVTQATRAALAIRAALTTVQAEGKQALQARLSVNVGEVIVAVIGSRLRRSVALLGPTVSLAARLLKQIPPGGIIAPHAAVEKLRVEAPEIAARFQLWEDELLLKGFEDERVIAYVISADSAIVRAAAAPGNRQFSVSSSPCNSDIAVSESQY